MSGHACCPGTAEWMVAAVLAQPRKRPSCGVRKDGPPVYFCNILLRYRKVGVYMWPQRALPPLPQAVALLSNLRQADALFDSVMLDIEGDNWLNYSVASNQAFVLGLVSVFADANVPVAVYSGWQFEDIFGANFTALSHLPLIYPHYDNTPSYVDISDNLYGGWAAPAGKQFFDGAASEQVCGSGALDWDWSQKPWW